MATMVTGGQCDGKAVLLLLSYFGDCTIFYITFTVLSSTATKTLNLLWRGIVQQALPCGGRYLIGCASVTTQDTVLGSAMYHRLEEFLVSPELRTKPTSAFAFPVSGKRDDNVRPPKLLRAYLAVGAGTAGPPALDREFKTIDFLTLLDLENMARSARSRYMR